MKKIYILLALAFTGAVSFAQTASNIQSTRCDGASFDLHQELNNGKVVVLFFEMGCGSCVSGATNLENLYKTLDTSRVRCYYLDYNTGSTCTDVEQWKTDNSLKFPSIPDAENAMKPYGSGMPLIVVTGGSNHKIFYKGGWNKTSISNGLNKATAAALAAAPVEVLASKPVIFPNPTNTTTAVTLQLNKSMNVTAEVYNASGQMVMQIYKGTLGAGEQNLYIPSEQLAAGVYTLKLQGDQISSHSSFVVVH
jgi:thiol-disulfide isomerase/thioredoxin